jgi:ATP-dependent helicase/DNAse subunit B
VDGFLQFSPLQAKLLGDLTHYVDRTLLTLTHEQERMKGIHRAFEATRQRLHRYGENIWQEKALNEFVFSPLVSSRCDPLSHLERHFMGMDIASVPADGALQLIEAPDVEQEARAVLRQVKALLLEGVSPEQIVVLARNVDLYADLLRAIGQNYDVPLVFRKEVSLTENPAVSSLLRLLDLHHLAVDFRRQDLIDVLQSPYFSPPQLDPEDVDVLNDISLKYQVVHSSEDWLEAIRQAQQPWPDEDKERDAIVVPEGLEERLAEFLQIITPPQRGTPHEYLVWLDELLGPDVAYQRHTQAELSEDGDETLADEQPWHLQFYKNIRLEAESSLSAPDVRNIREMSEVRDIHAMKDFRACLEEMRGAYDLLAGDGGQVAELTWEQFRTDLQLALDSRRREPIGGTYRHQRVLVTTTFEARGLAHDYVFIMGLSEGIFPAPIQEDSLYSDRERTALQQETGFEMQTTAERGSDATIFYECCAIAQKRLILSRPTLDEKANLLPESVLWRAVNEILVGLHKISYRAGEAPRLTEAADMRETSIGLAAALSRHPESEAEDKHMSIAELMTIYRWLLDETVYADVWANVGRAREIEEKREKPSQPFDEYAGVLRQVDLIDQAAAYQDANHLWSASQFNDYGYCPFRFFSRRLLKLEEFQEPEEGYDAAQLGSLQHELLEHTYQRIADEGLAIQPSNRDRALGLLRDVTDDLLPGAPARFGFRQTALWEKEQGEIMQRLRLLVELDFSDDENSPFVKNPRARNWSVADIVKEAGEDRYVHQLEAAFGFDGTAPVILADNLRTRGFIDRIDRVGDQLIVIDYKSGSHTPTNTDMEEGRNFQMMLYLLAAKQLFEKDGLTVAGGMFWSIRTRKANGQLRADDPRVMQALEQLNAFIENGRLGYYPVNPAKLEGGKCFRYCEYSQFCRIQRTRDYTAG